MGQERVEDQDKEDDSDSEECTMPPLGHVAVRVENDETLNLRGS